MQFRREASGWVLRIFVDVPWDADSTLDEAARRLAANASPSIEDCERVSRDVSAILDVEETIDQSYILEVSSPGLDRPLRSVADYRRFTGRLAKIVVSEPVDRQTHLKDVSPDSKMVRSSSKPDRASASSSRCRS